MSLTYILNKNDSKYEPWGTPDAMTKKSDCCFLILTASDQFEKYDINHRSKSPWIPIASTFFIESIQVLCVIGINGVYQLVSPHLQLQ